MYRLPKTVSTYGAAAIVAAALLFAGPRAAHAIAAALVQVTNTPANPAVSQDISKLASQNVLLGDITGDITKNSHILLYQMFPNGTNGGSPPPCQH